MIDGSESEPPFCVRTWLKKIGKIVCRKVLLQKNVCRGV